MNAREDRGCPRAIFLTGRVREELSEYGVMRIYDAWTTMEIEERPRRFPFSMMEEEERPCGGGRHTQPTYDNRAPALLHFIIRLVGSSNRMGDARIFLEILRTRGFMIYWERRWRGEGN